MYIIYYVFNTGEGDAFHSNSPAITINNPSECQWIVPGTIDPND